METNISSEVKIFLSATLGVNGNIQYLISKLTLPAERWCRSDQRGNWPLQAIHPQTQSNGVRTWQEEAIKEQVPGWSGVYLPCFSPLLLTSMFIWHVWILLLLSKPPSTWDDCHTRNTDYVWAAQVSHRLWVAEFSTLPGTQLTPDLITVMSA